jgi:hypothetical protein
LRIHHRQHTFKAALVTVIVALLYGCSTPLPQEEVCSDYDTDLDAMASRVFLLAVPPVSVLDCRSEPTARNPPGKAYEESCAAVVSSEERERLATNNLLEPRDPGSPPDQVKELAEAFSITLSVAYGSRMNDQVLYFDADRSHVVAHRVYRRCSRPLDSI